MADKPYGPRKGGTADLAIGHLKASNPNWMTAVALAEAIEVDRNVLDPCMEIPVRHGLASKFRFRGAVCYGVVGAAPAGAVDSEGNVVEGVEEIPVREAEREAGLPEPTFIPPMPPIPPLRVERRGEVRELVFDEAPKDDFACAVFSDGRFLLEFQGKAITLPDLYTKRLLKYLERMVEVE